MTDYTTLIQISSDSYSTNANTDTINGYVPVNFDSDTNFWYGGTGFTAHAYYSTSDNTLVVAFAGTGDGLDILTDAQLAISGSSNQDNFALNFASNSIDQLNSEGIHGFDIVYTGHSLGGFLEL